MFQLTRSLKFLRADYPVDQVSRPDYPATIFLLSSNFIKKLTNQFTQSPTINFSGQITRSAKFLVQITRRRLTYFSMYLLRTFPEEDC